MPDTNVCGVPPDEGTPLEAGAVGADVIDAAGGKPELRNGDGGALGTGGRWLGGGGGVCWPGGAWTTGAGGRGVGMDTGGRERTGGGGGPDPS